MHVEQVLKLLDNAYLGHEGAVQEIVNNLSAIMELVDELDQKAALYDTQVGGLNDEVSDLQGELQDLRYDNQDLEEKVFTLERAIETLEEELAEARQALDEALNEER